VSGSPWWAGTAVLLLDPAWSLAPQWTIRLTLSSAALGLGQLAAMLGSGP